MRGEDEIRHVWGSSLVDADDSPYALVSLIHEELGVSQHDAQLLNKAKKEIQKVMLKRHKIVGKQSAQGASTPSSASRPAHAAAVWG